MQAGVPFPKGALWDAARVKVVDRDGREVDADVIVRSRWGHDEHASIRWLGLDFQSAQLEASWPARGEGAYRVVFGPEVSRQSPMKRVTATQDDTGITIDTGAATLHIRRDGFNVIDHWTTVGGQEMTSDTKHGLYVVDHEGTIYRAANDDAVELSIEEQTAMRVVVRAAGWYVKDGAGKSPVQNFDLPTDKLCRFVTRIEAYAGKPYARVMTTLILTHDTFNVHLIDAGMSLPIMAGKDRTEAAFGVEDGETVRLTVSPAGVRGVQHLHNAYTLEDGQGQVQAQATHSAGWAVARNGKVAFAMTLRDLWQRYPKELEVLPGEMTLHIWPAHGREHPEIIQTARDQIHRLLFAHQGKEMKMSAPWDYFTAACNYYNDDSYGVYKATGHVMAAVHATALGAATTSDVLLELGTSGDEAAMEERAACFMLAPHAMADPKWNCDSFALGKINPYDPATFPSIEQTISNTMRGYWKHQDMAEMFGMWIYRSWLHNNYLGNGEWELARLYNGTHHHEAIIPWLLYARSGDPFYLKQGMANIRQLTDVQMLHHADERYDSKEFHSGQGQLVGSTKHDDCISPWGNDHGIMGHLCCYNAAITAYYLTGDLRLREVVVDEWLNTLLGDRLNPEYKAADRSNTIFVPVPRDNSVSISETLDAYQLTYDPRLLVYLAPRYDIWLNAPGCMGTDWGQPAHHEMLFRGSEEVVEKLMAGAAVWREGKTDTTRAIGRPINAPHEQFALAGIIDPAGTWALDALTMGHYPIIQTYAWNRFAIKSRDVFCYTGDYMVFMPRVMYSLAHCAHPEAARALGAAQPMPRHSVRPTVVVLREDQDQDFKVFINGDVKKDKGFDVQVYDPTGSPAASMHVPAGVQALELTVPSDGKTGQYVMIVGATQNDICFAPFTNLPEVYVTGFWTSGDSQTRLFTRSAGDAGATTKMTFSPHQGPGTIFAADQETTLATTETGESMTLDIGTEGVWAWNRSTYMGASRDTDKPLILSISPDRWFMPDEQSMSFYPPK